MLKKEWTRKEEIANTLQSLKRKIKKSRRVYCDYLPVYIPCDYYPCFSFHQLTEQVNNNNTDFYRCTFELSFMGIHSWLSMSGSSASSQIKALESIWEIVSLTSMWKDFTRCLRFVFLLWHLLNWRSCTNATLKGFWMWLLFLIEYLVVATLWRVINGNWVKKSVFVKQCLKRQWMDTESSGNSCFLSEFILFPEASCPGFPNAVQKFYMFNFLHMCVAGIMSYLLQNNNEI